jgi:DNA polymerase-3 subunit delta'
MLWVLPEKPGQAIKIDQIREVSDFIQQTGLQGDYRVVVINPASSMNTHAANALLKTLEEPTPGALLILISDQLNRLPATIISRCQRLTFPVPQQNVAMQWLKQTLPDTTQDLQLLLKIANGSPLQALLLSSDESLTLRKSIFNAICSLARPHADPLKLAAEIEDKDPLPILDYMLSWMIDLSRLMLNDNVITNHDYATQLAEMTAQLPLTKCMRFLNDLQRQRKYLAEGIHLNKQLVVEAMLIRWQQLVTR